MAKIKATHRLRRPHQVFYDPSCHFLKGEKPEKGAKIRLPAGTHVIPTEMQLINLPDRFESLIVPEQPAEVEVDDDDGEPDGDDPDADAEEAEADGEDETSGSEEEEDPDEEEGSDGEDQTPGTPSEADMIVDDALSEVNGEWDALTSVQLEDLADGYDIDAENIEGTGSGGNVLKGDWMAAVQRARGATE